MACSVYRKADEMKSCQRLKEQSRLRGLRAQAHFHPHQLQISFLFYHLKLILGPDSCDQALCEETRKYAQLSI